MSSLLRTIISIIQAVKRNIPSNPNRFNYSHASYCTKVCTSMLTVHHSILTRMVDSRTGNILEYDEKREEKTVENLQ
jgi:hypothetical protein